MAERGLRGWGRWVLRAGWGRWRHLRAARALLGADPCPVVLTAQNGAPLWANAAARRALGAAPARFDSGAEALLGLHVADPVALVHRLCQAARAGQPAEHVLGPDGLAARVTVLSVPGAMLLWRIEPPARAMAAPAPLGALWADAEGQIIAADHAAQKLVGKLPRTLPALLGPAALLARAGLARDGLARDGLARDGLAEDGLAQDGLAQDGLVQDGLAQDGLAQDGLVQDGLARDGLPGNEPHEIRLAGTAARPALNGLALPPCPRSGLRRLWLWPAPAVGGAGHEGAGAGPAPQEAGLFEALPVALVQCTADGRIAHINRRAREILHPAAPGAALREHLEGPGRPLDDWLASALPGAAAAPGPAPRPEVLRVIREDRDLFVQVALERLAQPGGPEALVVVMQDVTALKTLETQVVQSQKMQAVGQLAGGIAHDFNNLLTAISGHCDLLLLRRDAFDPDFADITQIAQNANRAATLVRQLLAFSRKQTLRPEVLDLRDTLGDVTHLLNRLLGETLHLTLTHEPGHPAIRADKHAFEQVIVNLVVNARDAMPDGGEICIETATRRLDSAERHGRATLQPGGYAVVRVRDGGVGIAPELIEKIFEPFYSSKPVGAGTGLGLSMAYGIVKQSGGFIFVDSTPGQGSCFTLYFPLAEPVARAGPEGAAPPGPAVTAPPPAQSRRVLLVEDEAPVRSFAARALALSGFEVFEAANAEEALALLADPVWSVDVIVTDVVMPGLDGPGWVRQALADRPDMRVLFISGYAEDRMVEASDRIEGARFLAKPFSLAQLSGAVRALADAEAAGPVESRMTAQTGAQARGQMGGAG